MIEIDGKTFLDADEREQESRPLLFLKKNPDTFLLACALYLSVIRPNPQFDPRGPDFSKLKQSLSVERGLK
jgi:hypothetical protein